MAKPLDVGLGGAEAVAGALEARKVALIGASASPHKMGHAVARGLLQNGFAGELAFIGRSRGEVLGHPIIDDIQAAKGADVAMLATPAATAAGIVRQCGELGIRLAIVAAAGFADEGAPELEEELKTVATQVGVRVIGPNCLGMHVTRTGLAMSGIPFAPSGHVSVVAQSGGVPAQSGIRLMAFGEGFDALIPLGNKCDIGFTDCLEALGWRKTTRSILLYLERVDEGDQFYETLARVTQRVPVVVLLGGETDVSARAMHSHTGSLLDHWSRVAGLLEDCGAQVARNPQEAYAAAAAAPHIRRRAQPAHARPSRVLMVCHGGANSVFFADAFSLAGFETPALSPPLAAAISRLIRRNAQNPVEFGAALDDDPSLIASVVDEALRHANEFDAIAVCTTFGSGEGGPDVDAESKNCARRLAEVMHSAPVPIVVSSPYVSRPKTDALDGFREGGVPCLEWAEESVGALALALGDKLPRHEHRTQTGAKRTLTAAESWDSSLRSETDAVVQVLDGHRVPHALGVVYGRHELAQLADSQWVLRLEGLPHKTSAGAIRVGITTPEVAAAFDELAQLAETIGVPPDIRIAPLVEHKHEVLVTLWRSEREGDGWVVGAGGIDVENDPDLAIGRLPGSHDDVLRTLRRTRFGQALIADCSDGLGALSHTVLALVEAFNEGLPHLVELECNPVAIAADSAVVLDVLPTPSKR